MNRIDSEDSSAESSINYEEAAVAEVTIDDLEYRVDSGKDGTALCVSSRVPGSWDWSFTGEIRFDGTDVRSKVLERAVRDHLARALREALSNSSDGC